MKVRSAGQRPSDKILGSQPATLPEINRHMPIDLAERAVVRLIEATYHFKESVIVLAAFPMSIVSMPTAIKV